MHDLHPSAEDIIIIFNLIRTHQPQFFGNNKDGTISENTVENIEKPRF